MSLPIKDPPRQLTPRTFELVWPGDTAVDLEASDLVLWAKQGGKAGLVFKDGEKPDVFKYRALMPQALNHYFAAVFRKSANSRSEAFRYGFVSYSDRSIKTYRDRPVDIEGLHDEAIGFFGQFTAMLPQKVLAETEAAAMAEREREEVSEELSSVDLPSAIGYFILAESFRRRPDA